MKKLSYTKIDTYKKCPRQFMHVYVTRDVKSKDSEALRYGNFLHSVLEDIGETIRKNDNVIPDNIKMTATMSWRKHAATYKISRALLDESKEVIASYGKILRGTTGYSIIGNETNFKYEVGDFTIVGKVDQVLEKDGELLVRDYKTNKQIKYLLDDPLQLKIYVMALSDQLNIPVEKIAASFMFLRFNCDEYPNTFSAQDIAETEFYLKDIGMQIRESIATGDFKAIVGPLCPYCPAVTICPEANNAGWVMKKYSTLVAEGKV